MDALPKEHESLWFIDGNVVLATDTLLFRVHKGVLSLYSTVLRDMFDLPIVHANNQPSLNGVINPDLYDGLPLVLMSGEKGEDLMHLLRAIYERECVTRVPVSSPLGSS